MDTSLTLQLISNALSVIVCIAIVFKYIQHKKRLDVLQELENLKCKNELTLDDKNYIHENEKEYEEKALKAEANLKVLNPILILIIGILFGFLTTSEAMIHLNVVVVVFLYFMLDKNHKKSTYGILHELNKEN